MMERSRAGSIRVGRYAQAEVDLSAVPGVPIELSLAAPFGALISALLLERPFRVSRLALDDVTSERLSSRATFSAKVTKSRENRAATPSLLVYHGSRLFVRGEANVLVNVAGATARGSFDPWPGCRADERSERVRGAAEMGRHGERRQAGGGGPGDGHAQPGRAIGGDRPARGGDPRCAKPRGARVRLPAESLSRIQSYTDLQKAVRANLPAR